MELVAGLDPDLLHARLFQHQRGQDVGLQVVADGDKDDVEIRQAQFGDRGPASVASATMTWLQRVAIWRVLLVDVDGQYLGILALQLFATRRCQTGRGR